MKLRKPYRPPGLMELAEAENLSEANIEQLTFAYSTIRGGRPKTLEEWQLFFNAIKDSLQEDFKRGPTTD